MTPARKRPVMTNEHKAALATGRAQGLAVRRYLEALERNRPRRGRRQNVDSLQDQLAEIEGKIRESDPLKRLHLIQQRKVVEDRLASGDGAEDISGLELAFIEAAPEYGSRKGINYATWREAGVSADVLRRAGIQRGSAT